MVAAVIVGAVVTSLDVLQVTFLSGLRDIGEIRTLVSGEVSATSDLCLFSVFFRCCFYEFQLKDFLSFKQGLAVVLYETRSY